MAVAAGVTQGRATPAVARRELDALVDEVLHDVLVAFCGGCLRCSLLIKQPFFDRAATRTAARLREVP